MSLFSASSGFGSRLEHHELTKFRGSPLTPLHLASQSETEEIASRPRFRHYRPNRVATGHLATLKVESPPHQVPRKCQEKVQRTLSSRPTNNNESPPQKSFLFRRHFTPTAHSHAQGIIQSHVTHQSLAASLRGRCSRGLAWPNDAHHRTPVTCASSSLFVSALSECRGHH